MLRVLLGFSREIPWFKMCSVDREITEEFIDHTHVLFVIPRNLNVFVRILAANQMDVMTINWPLTLENVV